jgi:hypothetical protein
MQNDEHVIPDTRTRTPWNNVAALPGAADQLLDSVVREVEQPAIGRGHGTLFFGTSSFGGVALVLLAALPRRPMNSRRLIRSPRRRRRAETARSFVNRGLPTWFDKE